MKSSLIFFALLFPVLAFSETYTIEDLDILAQENAVEEYFQHALDIRPSERGERWQAMTAKMADVWTKKILGRSSVSLKEFRQTEDLFRLPTLRSDDVFRSRRQEIGIAYLRSCLKSAVPCWETLKTFWETDQSDPELGLRLSELIVQNPNSPLPVWPFLSVALKSPLSEFYCKKPFVLKHLWEKFGIDYIRLGTQGDLLKKIDETVHPDCLPSLNAKAQSRLLSPLKPDDRELAFRLLEAQGKVDQKTTDFFYTVYLLERPSQGELFNYSWNRLKELGGSEGRRRTVLHELRTRLDYLPDDIFSSFDVSKRRAIVIHFKENFPEFLDLYAHQCIKYFGGTGSFPRGNPTLHCQDFMSSDLAPKVLEATTIKQYQSAKKI